MGFKSNATFHAGMIFFFERNLDNLKDLSSNIGQDLDLSSPFDPKPNRIVAV